MVNKSPTFYARGARPSKVTSQPPKGKQSNRIAIFNLEQQLGIALNQSSSSTDPASSEDSSQDSSTSEINVIAPMFYIDLQIGKAIVRALIDSGASSNFISEHVAHELHLRRHNMHDGQTFKVANWDTVHCTQFVLVYAQMHRVKFYLNLRVAPMYPDLILGVPFLVRFNPLIDWQARSFRVSRKGGHHWIPIVHKHSAYNLNPVAFPHDPKPSTTSTGVTFPEWEEYTG